jgi:hypothetical protein
MTGSDLLVLAPWAAFGAGLAIVWLLLRKSRRTGGRARPPGARRPAGRHGPGRAARPKAAPRKRPPPARCDGPGARP